MNFDNFDANKVIDEYEEGGKKKLLLDTPYSTTKGRADFVPHCLALFASIHLVRNANGLVAYSKTWDALPDVHKGLTKNNIGALMYICSTIPRSKLLYGLGSMTDKPKHATFTPLFMYAHKLYNNVKYSEWDKEDKDIGLALGKTLSIMFENYKKMGHVDKSLRKEICGDIKYSSYPKSRLAHGEYNGNLVMQELQVWLANADIRDTDSMLLDMEDWDNIPEAMDAQVPEQLMERH